MDLAIRTSHYLDPASFELRRDVTLLIEGSRILEVRKGEDPRALARKALDFEAALLLPGFVNCHAHLDLSHLHRQIPRGLEFPEWVEAVIKGRAAPEDLIQPAMSKACRRMAGSGTTAVIDVSVKGDSAVHMAAAGLGGVVALEVLGFDPANADAAMAGLDEIVRARFELDRRRLGPDAGEGAEPEALSGIDFGYAPHAPYSTSPEIYQHTFGRAFGESRICTTHLAETIDEQQFTRIGEGPLREMLERLGVDLAEFEGYDAGPITAVLWDWIAPWLESGENPRVLLVHCNYPQGEDFGHIERFHPSVCFCPRSHEYFENEEWPLAEMHATGANLVIGTDSLASNDGLEMLTELQVAAASHPAFSAIELFRAATLNGRKVLGIADDAADLVALGLPEGAADADLQALLQSVLETSPPVYATVAQGRVIARTW